jgi:predicted ArsR family transcriptional regulator
VRLLAEAGFAPEAVDAPGRPAGTAVAPQELVLHACPFLPLDPMHLEVVCSVHLGYLRGALDELGSPLDATSIHPFSSPDGCTARLEARSDA